MGNIKNVIINNIKNNLKLYIIMGIFILFVIKLFPIKCIFDERAINNNDYMFHYYHWNTFSEYMEDNGKTWGYDPFWMAGHPENAVCDVDNKGMELFTYIISKIGFNNVIFFKVFLLITFILGPLLTYFASRNWGFNKNTSTLILVFQLAFWTCMPYMRVMLTTGTYCYVFVSYLAIYILSLLYRYLKYRKVITLVGIWILSSLAVLLHIYSVIIICLPGILLYILYSKNQPRYVHICLLGSGILVFAINSFWIVPLFKFFHYSTVSRDYVNQGSITDFIMWSILSLLFVPGLVLILFFFRKGIKYFKTCNENDKKLRIFFGGTIIIYFLLGAFGKYTPLTRMLIPLRYHVNMFQYMVFPAAFGIIAFIHKIQVNQSKRKKVLKISLFSFTVVIPLILFICISKASNETNPIAWFYSRNLCQHIEDNESSKELIRWLRDNTSKKGRILIESIWSPMQKEQDDWFFMNYEPILPLIVDREFIGGPRDDIFLKHYYTGLHLDFVEFSQLAKKNEIPMILFEKNINTINLKTLKEYFSMYNIKWIIASRTEAKEYFDKFPEYLKKVKQFGKVWIYEVEQNTSYIINGTGKVEADYNHIYVSECSGGDIILKYHWMEGMKTDKKIKIEKIKLKEDPVEFIKINDAPREFEIYLE